jgi:hypothetical protein
LIRRSLRIGIRLGLLTGLLFVLFKVVQSRRVRPALPEGDGWGTPPDGQSRASDPGLVRPTMPERPIRPRDRAPADDPSLDAPSVAPGPTEPFAMVEPDTTAPPTTAAAAAEVPLDAVAQVEAEVDDQLSRAPQAQAAPPPPATSPAAKKRAPAKRAKKTAKKAAGRKATAATAPAARAPAPKKAARRARGAKAAPIPPEGAVAWVKAVGGTCPSTHPVKAKMATRIFHLPGMAFYHRVSADRCYADAAAAESDGLRVSKR